MLEFRFHKSTFCFDLQNLLLLQTEKSKTRRTIDGVETIRYDLRTDSVIISVFFLFARGGSNVNWFVERQNNGFLIHWHSWSTSEVLVTPMHTEYPNVKITFQRDIKYAYLVCDNDGRTGCVSRSPNIFIWELFTINFIVSVGVRQGTCTTLPFIQQLFSIRYIQFSSL